MNMTCMREPEQKYFAGRPSWKNGGSWFDNLCFKIHCGWVGIAMVDIDGKAPENNYLTNHFVLIVGYIPDSNQDKQIVTGIRQR